MKSFRLLPLLLLAIAASCVSEPAPKPKPSPIGNSVEGAYLRGVQAALDDTRNHVAAIRVLRAVKPGEVDRDTGLPVRDAGSDARDPAWAAFDQGYNETLYALASAKPKQPVQISQADIGEPIVVAIHSSLPQELTDDDGEFELRHGQIAISGTPDGRIRIAFGRLSSGVFQDEVRSPALIDQRLTSAVQKMPNLLMLGVRDEARRDQFAPIVKDLLDNRIILFTGQTRSGRSISAAMELSAQQRQMLREATQGPQQ